MDFVGAAGEKNMHDANFTCALFRFIQLTCEGHNLGEYSNHCAETRPHNILFQSGKIIYELKQEIQRQLTLLYVLLIIYCVCKSP